MKDLSDIRKEIDWIDRQIVELYEKRMKLTSQVAEYKISVGKAVFDKEREIDKLAAVAELAESDFTRHGVRELFEHIMSISRKKQYQLLTEHGVSTETGFEEIGRLPLSESQIACIEEDLAEAKGIFGNHSGVAAFSDASAAYKSLADGRADFLFVKSEPSANGICSINYNWVAEHGLFILSEYGSDRNKASRYLLLSAKPQVLDGADKISICFEAPDECGSLYHLMSHLTYNNLNMNRIESMVISEDPLDYRFFIDLTGNLNDSPIKNAVRGLSDEARSFRILGNYL